MSKITPIDFYQIFRALSEIFDCKLSKEAAEVYYIILSEYTVDELKGATTKILRTYKYNCMPKPAEFIEAITEIRKRKQEQTDDTKFLQQDPSEEDLKKIRDLVQGVVDKCGGDR